MAKGKPPKVIDVGTSADVAQYMQRQQKKAADAPTALGQALNGVNLKLVDEKLRALRGRVTSVASLKERMDLLESQAEEYAGVWLEARRAFTAIEARFGGPVPVGSRTLEDLKGSFEKWRVRAGIFAPDAEKALEAMATVERENPFYREGLTALNRKVRQEAMANVREGADKDITTLHGFFGAVAAGKDVCYALEGTFRPRDTNRELTAVVRFHAKNGAITVEDSNLLFLKKAGTTLDGRVKTFVIGPPEFRATGGPDLHPVIREMLTATWTREERREEILRQKEEILGLCTISCADLLAGKPGIAVPDHRFWGGGDRKGPATIAVESNGTVYTVKRYLSTVHGKQIQLVAEAGPHPLTDEGLNNIIGKMIRAAARWEGDKSPIETPAATG